MELKKIGHYNIDSSANLLLYITKNHYQLFKFKLKFM